MEHDYPEHLTAVWPKDKKDFKSRNSVLVSYKDVEERCALYKTGAPKTVSYLVGQLETCPKSGRIHLQMYAEYTSGKTWEAIRKTFADPGINIRLREGTPEQAAVYCTLDAKKHGVPKWGIIPGSQFEHGTRKAQGERNDLYAICEQIDQGATIREIALEHKSEFIKYGAGFMRYIWATGSRARMPQLWVTWIWGSPGTLKSDSIRRLHGTEDLGRYAGDNWYDYAGERVLLYEEASRDLFDPRGKIREKMLEFLDIGGVKLPVKGSFVPRRCTHVYMTSNYNPLTEFKGDTAVLRRLRVVEQRIRVTEETLEDKSEQRTQFLRALPKGRILIAISKTEIDNVGDHEDPVFEGYYVANTARGGDFSMVPLNEWDPNAPPQSQEDLDNAEKLRVLKHGFQPRVPEPAAEI